MAVSGGGDSLALLALASDWARRIGRRLLVLTVDHGLQPAAAGWAAFVVGLAERVGAEARVLKWEGAKPSTGLAAAARAARHRLLAEAARTAGATVVLLGHTSDDMAEAEVMRAEGTPLGRLQEWAPAPVWPEGRGVFLLRPLLACSRAELRAWLRAQGLTWIEDPANEDLRYARARVRAELSRENRPSPRKPRALERMSPPAESATPPLWGPAFAGLSGDREAVTVDGRIQAGRDLGRSPLAAAIACAAGGSGRLRRDRLDSVLDRLAVPESFTTTLGGARIVAGSDAVEIGRDAGEAARGGLAAISLEPGRPAVWDGRFELETDRYGLTVAALRGHAGALTAFERRALQAVPAWARPALPVVLGSGPPSSPVLAPGPAQARLLVGARLDAALGRILREP